MSNSTSLKFRQEVILPLAIISMIISIIALILSFFSGISYGFTICSYFLSIPAIILGILIITQNHTKTTIGLSIANLIICKISWIVTFLFALMEIWRALHHFINA